MAKIKPARADASVKFDGFSGLGQATPLGKGCYDLCDLRPAPDGSLTPRAGYRKLFSFPGERIRGLWDGTLEGIYHCFAAAEDRVYLLTLDGHVKTTVASISAGEEDVNFLCHEDTLYLLTGEEILSYSVTDKAFSTVVPYTPLYGENWDPVTMGEVKEVFNLLTPTIRVHYSNPNGSSKFFLPFYAKSVEKVRIGRIITKEFTLSDSKHYVTVPPGANYLGVEISFTIDLAWESRDLLMRSRAGFVRPGDLGRDTVEEEERATYLLRFWREEDGEVRMEKSTKDCVIRRVATGLSHYPVAYFHWHECKNSYLGSAPVSDMVANQKYINTAYAMAMKHMSDTAFSKIVYDKSRIPEWSNEIGEAIAAMGGGNVGDAVSVVGVGKLQEGYLELIENVIENTKAMMGATESALGDAAANNTSAILALQTASRLTLHHVRANFYRCIGKLAEIWADMLCTYCPPERLLAVCREDGTNGAKRANYGLLKTQLLRATAEAGNADRYTPTSTVTVLDKLLEMGALTVKDYLELLPDGVLADRDAVKEKIRTKGDITNE